MSVPRVVVRARICAPAPVCVSEPPRVFAFFVSEPPYLNRLCALRLSAPKGKFLGLTSNVYPLSLPLKNLTLVYFLPHFYLEPPGKTTFLSLTVNIHHVQDCTQPS